MPRGFIATALSSLAALIVMQYRDSVCASDPITPEQFANLEKLIKPRPSEERWTQIPWLVSLAEARERAAAEAKPILLWEMDGHPLGCT